MPPRVRRPTPSSIYDTQVALRWQKGKTPNNELCPVEAAHRPQRMRGHASPAKTLARPALCTTLPAPFFSGGAAISDAICARQDIPPSHLLSEAVTGEARYPGALLSAGL